MAQHFFLDQVGLIAKVSDLQHIFLDDGLICM